jgi:ankyrin repeat protein
MKILLNYDIDPNVQTDFNFDALLLATFNEKIEVVECLLDNGRLNRESMQVSLRYSFTRGIGNVYELISRYINE